MYVPEAELSAPDVRCQNGRAPKRLALCVAAGPGNAVGKSWKHGGCRGYQIRLDLVRKVSAHVCIAGREPCHIALSAREYVARPQVSEPLRLSVFSDYSGIKP